MLYFVNSVYYIWKTLRVALNEIVISGVPAKMHRQTKNLAKNKLGICMNQLIIDELNAFVATRHDDGHAEHGAARQIEVTGVSDVLYKRVKAMAKKRYGLTLNRFMVMLLMTLLDKHSLTDKEKTGI